MCAKKSLGRRNVMKLIIAGIGVTTGGILGVPATMNALTPVLKIKREKNWRSLGKLEDFKIGQISGASVSTRLDRGSLDVSLKKEVYVWRRDENDIVVYSRSCTDLGCPVKYDSGSECFFCPCHGGIFSKEGERMAGPPKLPLYRYEARVVDGFLEVDISSVPMVA